MRPIRSLPEYLRTLTDEELSRIVRTGREVLEADRREPFAGVHLPPDVGVPEPLRHSVVTISTFDLGTGYGSTNERRRNDHYRKSR
jgi:hypothetical protein